VSLICHQGKIGPAMPVLAVMASSMACRDSSRSSMRIHCKPPRYRLRIARSSQFMSCAIRTSCDISVIMPFTQRSEGDEPMSSTRIAIVYHSGYGHTGRQAESRPAARQQFDDGIGRRTESTRLLAGRRCSVEYRPRPRHQDSSRMVQIQCTCGRSPEWSFGGKHVAVPLEMFTPGIRSRIKQGVCPAIVGIENLHPLRRAQVARRATPGEIIELGSSVSRAWHDMLNMKCCPLQCLMHMAVLATSIGPCLDETSDFPPSVHSGLRPRR
jgi:hypothetical protein